MSTPKKNRDEVKSLIQALTAIHSEADYKDTLAEQIADNLVFRKEVTGTLAGSGSVAVDFEDKDYIELTLSGNSTMTFSNIETGEEKVLKIVKSAGQTVAFSGAQDQTPDADNVTALTNIYYSVYKKDTGGNIVVQPISKTFGAASETAKGIAELATQAEVETGTDPARVITPETLTSFTSKIKLNKVQIGAWDMSNPATHEVVVAGLAAADIAFMKASVYNDGTTNLCYDFGTADTNFNANGRIIFDNGSAGGAAFNLKANPASWAGFTSTSKNRGYIVYGTLI